jgi:hypothetical protein
MAMTSLTARDAKLFGQVAALTCFILIAVVTCVQWARLIIKRRPKKIVAATRYVAYTRVPLLDMALSHVIVSFDYLKLLMHRSCYLFSSHSSSIF